MPRHLTGWRVRLAPHLLFLVPELLAAAGPFVIASIARAYDGAEDPVPDVDPLHDTAVFAELFAQGQHVPLAPFETLHRRKDGHPP